MKDAEIAICLPPNSSNILTSIEDEDQVSWTTSSSISPDTPVYISSLSMQPSSSSVVVANGTDCKKMAPQETPVINSEILVCSPPLTKSLRVLSSSDNGEGENTPRLPSKENVISLPAWNNVSTTMSSSDPSLFSPVAGISSPKKKMKKRGVLLANHHSHDAGDRVPAVSSLPSASNGLLVLETLDGEDSTTSSSSSEEEKPLMLEGSSDDEEEEPVTDEPPVVLLESPVMVKKINKRSSLSPFASKSVFQAKQQQIAAAAAAAAAASTTPTSKTTLCPTDITDDSEIPQVLELPSLNPVKGGASSAAVAFTFPSSPSVTKSILSSSMSSPKAAGIPGSPKPLLRFNLEANKTCDDHFKLDGTNSSSPEKDDGYLKLYQDLGYEDPDQVRSASNAVDLSQAELTLGEKLHHHRMPSVILEENPYTLEEDEERASSNESIDTNSDEGVGVGDSNQQQQQQHPLLSAQERDQPPTESHHPLQEQLVIGRPKSATELNLSTAVDVGQPSSSIHGHQQQTPRTNGSSTPVGSPERTFYKHQQHYHQHHYQQHHHVPHPKKTDEFVPQYFLTILFDRISKRLLWKHYAPFAAATWIGFWALLFVTCSNYVLMPMRDAIALQVGVEHIPKLTLLSTVMAFCSSVPIGWLFEAPDPGRRRLWKRMGLTRGETQGTSLALFYRCFAIILCSYAIGFQVVEVLRTASSPSSPEAERQLYEATTAAANGDVDSASTTMITNTVSRWWPAHSLHTLWVALGQTLYIAFFLIVHIMKLHSLSLVWGVTTEAMEYEEVARKRSQMESNKTRLQRLALVGFGGTLGGILGSILTSSMARLLKLPGLLLLAASLLEVSAQLSIELGRIMQKHWEEQQLFQSSNDLASLDASMQRSSSMGCMKRVASGNSLNRTKSTSDLGQVINGASPTKEHEPINEDTFVQRLLRGITTILRSRLLMAVFTYNALYASTTVLLSFQRAALVASRNANASKEADTAFLANINMASSVAIFAFQASGLGAFIAQNCGPRGTLSLMPLIRLLGCIMLAWWHHVSQGQSPNLLIFLIIDECTKIMNLAIAKPVRESLWRGLSNEARYEAKPIVDTLANRWGAGSAAFLVSFLNKVLDIFGATAGRDGVRMFCGFPPILFLCLVISAWWTVVSADLGHIRAKIDSELKKRQ